MWERHKELLYTNQIELTELETLYIGGGTPSLWGERGAHFLSELLKEEGVALSSNVEFTLEVNPGTWTSDSIKAWQRAGVNRFSLGIQSLRKDYLKLLDRVHSVEDVYETLEFFNKINASFSVDFMLGLPWSIAKERSIEDELEEILKFNPEHLSLYILTAKASYPYKSDLPDDVYLEEEYLRVSNSLRAKGFDHYEVSNFSKAGKESRHNLMYWKGGSVAAMGPSAVGFLADSNLRYKWKTSSATFEEEVLNKEEFALEKLYLGLRISDGIKLSDHFSGESLVSFRDLANKWQDQGLALFEEKGLLRLTPRGYLVLDTLMNQIFSIT